MEPATKFVRTSLYMSNDGVAEHLRKRANEVLPFGKLFDVGQRENTLALFGASAAYREKAREASVCLAIAGIAKKAAATGEIKTASHDEACFRFGFLDVRMRMNNSRQRVAVGDCNSGVTVPDCGCRQLLRMRSTTQKTEVGRDLQFGVHANSDVPA